MNIAVLNETGASEARVALMPDSVQKLVALKASVSIESGAGLGAARTDDDYTAAGASVVADRNTLLANVDVLVVVSRPSEEDFKKMKQGAVVLGFLRPLDEPAKLTPALENGLTTFSMELVPRITRAQAMDALSSMATVAGYKAVVLGAGRIPRMFPLLMTAAGTVPPARVLVLGAGVAGLQAIATARRLGAVVEAYDVRPAVKDEVKSLGATFIELALEAQEGAGGYAREQSEDFLRRQRELIGDRVAASDVVITTAAIPGRKAPILVTADMVRRMRAGSVIVDLAAETGGNCELTEAGKIIQVGGVTIDGTRNLPSTMPVHASQLYSKNVSTLLLLLVKDGTLKLDFNDEIVKGACVTHDGAIVNERAKELVEAASR